MSSSESISLPEIKSKRGRKSASPAHRSKAVAKKRGRGQPRFQPTEGDRATVLMMKGAGFTQEEIALCIGKEGISEPTLRKYFRFELTAGSARINGICAKGIVQGMMKGQSWALTFWAKSRMGWREKSEVEVSNPGQDNQLAELASAIRATP